MPKEGLYESTPRPDLNPCPFCGSTNLELCNLVDERDFYVHCEDCGVQQLADHTEAEAIRLWNGRTQHDYEANQGAALFDALLCLYSETADYIRVNSLGDVHGNQSMQAARSALVGAGWKGIV